MVAPGLGEAQEGGSVEEQNLWTVRCQYLKNQDYFLSNGSCGPSKGKKMLGGRRV